MNKSMTYSILPHLSRFPVLSKYDLRLVSGLSVAQLNTGSSTGPSLSKMIENIPKLKSAEVLEINVKVS